MVAFLHARKTGTGDVYNVVDPTWKKLFYFPRTRIFHSALRAVPSPRLFGVVSDTIAAIEIISLEYLLFLNVLIFIIYR